MLIIVTSKADPIALYFDVKDLIYVHAVHQEDYRRWDEEIKEDRPQQWALEFILRNEETLTIGCANEQIAKDAIVNIPHHIYNNIKAHEPVIMINLGDGENA